MTYRVTAVNWDGLPVVSGPLTWQGVLHRVQRTIAMGYDPRLMTVAEDE